MKITISGSMQHEPRMSEIAEELTQRGYEVEKPSPVAGGEAAIDAALRRKLIDEHFAKIDTSEALLVVNEPKNGIDNYIGGNTLIEMAYAYSQGLDTFLLNSVPESLGYTDEIRGVQPVVLNGSLDALDGYIERLPLAYMSTTSALKHTAVARAMRKAGLPVRVDGVKVESGVNEQPMTIEETREGAMNRHAALKKLGQSAAYYVTVESGQHPIHEDRSLYGCNVVIIEPAGGEPKVGASIDIEFPQAMLDLVPSLYPDLGTLVQHEYGAKEKDPYPYFTNGRLTRRETIESATYNVAVQLENGK